ncbi:tRNA (adenosine(37)-N6)-threonylcarbamoyltransferase complex dimerization subunit type 1 TsaB [Marinococcus halophilus]|uniref:tRNA (Adenosine(37)-N6)-threonylcarbamoyltransferase complex dimerization subunit type 1 TsaB n=1 Tax=Marinococcus halophilus TaxID=1371 RepID=A0A510YA22_MARHA|nr:tRNA (adenosine(37)-N6)-threonylcarbamoyltransferase complex dimerization subunit type 1 TsaB [Marinococcus halophilus]OZT78790.1 tRNA (adenosine(37)-N6)-threonylcarbamoyltransferase complex dimerization subunit type 1 TsaB [Marinococcus halophilus]GEK60242.1 tRNA (adenosine(37)-N6)-threonylcarbamoyltransferase complex dimerization subunit type 1 TsaB [Marinococcus halophilus]
MKMLAIDTSTHVLGIALADEQKILGEYTTNIRKNHSIRLMPAVESLMKESGTAPGDLEAIAVTTGPGSYTGVRIGVTTAKSMAWALNIPLYPVSTLQMFAQNGLGFPGLVSPLIDARRNQVYTAVFSGETTKNIVERQADDQIILLSEWLGMLDQRQENVLFVGEDTDTRRPLIQEQLGSRAVFADWAEQTPRPAEIIRVARTIGEPREAHAVVPEYAQLAEAEKNWQKTQSGRSE